MFNDLPVKISNPQNIKNGYINFEDSCLSTIVGLLIYSLEKNPFFELNSKKQLREQIQTQEEVKKVQETKTTTSSIQNTVHDDTQIGSLESLKNIQSETKKEKTSFFSKAWKKIGELL